VVVEAHSATSLVVIQTELAFQLLIADESAGAVIPDEIVDQLLKG
jgi:hypothetical protein